MGKFVGSDLFKGNFIVLVLFVLEKEFELWDLIDIEFIEEGFLEVVIVFVYCGGGIDRVCIFVKE